MESDGTNLGSVPIFPSLGGCLHVLRVRADRDLQSHALGKRTGRVSSKVTDPIPSVFSAPSLPGLRFTVVDRILPNIQTPIYCPPLCISKCASKPFCWPKGLLLRSGYGDVGGRAVLVRAWSFVQVEKSGRADASKCTAWARSHNNKVGTHGTYPD